MKKNERTEFEYRNAAKDSFSIAGMCRALGLGTFGANYRRIHKAIEQYNIDISHFTGQGWNVGGVLDPNRFRKKRLTEILVQNSSYDDTNALKKKLIYEGIKECKCEKCGRTEWENEQIPLELHHINGDRKDNRLENLQILCPNCHALTDNYCGKNKKTILKSKKEREEKFRKIYGNKDLKELFGESKKEKKYNYCLFCGKKLTKKQNKYCSVECAHNAQKKLPSDEILLKYINEGKDNQEIARMYNVTETSIRKWKKKKLQS